jgi:hypothetical protein
MKSQGKVQSEVPNIMALAKKTTEHPHHTPLYSRASNEETTAWPDIPRRGGGGEKRKAEMSPKWRQYERNGSGL